MNNSKVIHKLISTEKSNMAMANNCYVFKVATSASKASIKSALEQVFNISVLSVNTTSSKGKTKRNGRTKDGKKAYVKLAPGNSLPFMVTDI